MMRILVITHKRLANLRNGHDLRVWHLCRELAKRHELYLLTVNLSSLDKFNDRIVGLADVFKEMNDAPSLPATRPSLKRHFRRNDSNYYSLSYPHHFSEVTNAIADICEQNSISHIIVFSLFLAEFVRPFSSNKKILFDLMDSEVLTLTREVQFLPPWPLQLKTRLKSHLMHARLARAEACLPHWFNHVTTINDADSHTVCRLSGKSSNISTIPNGVSTEFAETFDANGVVAKRRGVAFWGNLSFKPNSDAVRFFYENVYRPYLAPAGIEWCVVGKDAERWLVEAAKRDHGIRLTGFVDDICSVLDEYPVMVNPMRIGSGLKNKVLEAFAMGLAVVSTGLGIEAVSMAREGIDYMRADEPEKIAVAIKLLIEDERLRLSIIESARRVVLEHYTWSKVAGDLDALLRSL
ncbi:glycosyltransferase family 4 protein [Bradyrhizobium xenonodulans]|uniref:Glycosyltransferase family 4 protein n=1 Tax=Bradyrhizobium xenonodulans TaxID=2736875 RepID=A0ABY7MSY9_9BRAD|nr:glycosyltransferase [Bradyrhizobium xenonodulans]WBL81439.1 glycosyltransferase family 4 protein [Bradyrhizobium xenonodulans]